MRRRVFDHRHRDTIYAQAHMANVMRLRGQLDAAETLLRTAVAALDDVVGPSHELALHARMFLALTWRDQGRINEAVAELEAIVAEQTRLRGAKTFVGLLFRFERAMTLKRTDSELAHDLEVAFGPEHFYTRSITGL